ncbi:RNA polymerase sigma-70 factor [Nesterenkonia sp. CL21]|uniref:RNA polymerase sigma-70 factor n=1 Tax=Nesterenkonia sp. CL21 TaxID=3064894 RepID=UPI0028783D8D|nr:RNA polymerase sigma-70 factor [Nesterenkonia sp. CL21]MDS2171114.1 RNA polymerase sigma-70 factor [Nesterenkonia sp. CL21]
MGTQHQRTEEFTELRPLLFSLAYRILGSAAEAEDVLQDAWLRYARTDAVVETPRAFLTIVVTRLAVDVLRSSRLQREHYVGHWLPEPVLTDHDDDPAAAAERDESISMASLLLLERLSPLERAVYVLREVFSFDYADIAETVERSEAACRQLAVRARKHMALPRPRYAADPQTRLELTRRFIAAFRHGDLEGLRDLLTAEVTMVGDGGGKAPSVPHPVSGRDKVARLLASVGAPMAAIGVRLESREINGSSGLLTRTEDGEIVNAVILEISEDGVEMIRAVSNPDKLRHLGPVSDIWRLKEEFQQARASQREASMSQREAPMSQRPRPDRPEG